MDLSGPHEPSPRPGRKVQKDNATFFLVLTLRPDRTGEKIDMGTQTDAGEPEAPEPQPELADRPLVYAALLGSKAEAPDAIHRLLAQIKDEHASFAPRDRLPCPQ